MSSVRVFLHNFKSPKAQNSFSLLESRCASITSQKILQNPAISHNSFVISHQVPQHPMIFLQTPKKTYMIFPSIPRISHDFSIPSPKPPENYHGFPCSQDLVTLHRQLLAAERSAEHSDTPSLCRDGHWMGASVAMLAAETWFRLSQNKNPIPQLLRIAQLGLRNSLVGLRNYRIAQL